MERLMPVRFFIFIPVLMWVVSLAFAKSHHPEEFLKQLQGSKNEGEQIVAHFCVNCHAPNPLISLGAPTIGSSKDWVIRLKQGMDILFQHTNEGLNAMPPRGGCFECSDEQLLKAILAMLPSKVKN
jgi:cytochrome c5